MKLPTTKLSFFIVVLSFAGFAYSQPIDTIRYIDESFETTFPAGWTTIGDPSGNPLIKWKIAHGGHDHNPLHPYDLDSNALFWWSDDFITRYGMLISPPMDLSIAGIPELSFWLAMRNSLLGDNDMKLLFKAGNSAPWDTIATFTNEIYNWTKYTYNINEIGSKYLVENFRIAFLGISRAGHGVCIDKTVIEEKDAIDRYVRRTYVDHVTHDVVPSDCPDIPLIKITIDVVGNTDSVILNSLRLHSLYPLTNVVNQNSFSIFITPGPSFQPTLQSGASAKIADNVGFSGNYINFTGLSKKLKTGYNYLWIAADISTIATQGSLLDFEVQANDISANSGTFPSSTMSPAGVNIVEESILFDDFDGALKWTLQPDFEVAVSEGHIVYNTRDPYYAYSGTKIMGTDLTDNGAYLVNIGPGTEYYATSSPLNLKYYQGVKLSARVWNGFESNDRGVIQVSTDGGSNWTSIWESHIDGLIRDNDWNRLLISDELNDLVVRHSDVRFRFGITYSDATYAYAGFNIDNFAITGNHLEDDLAITELISPYNDCLGSGNNEVTVRVKNFAFKNSVANIPIFYGIWGADSILVRDTIHVPGGIGIDDSITFTFNTPANFPVPAVYDEFVVILDLPQDEDANNDTIKGVFFIQDNIIPPNVLTFEHDGGFWEPSEGSEWTCRIPDGSIPVYSGSSPNSWIASPYGTYTTNENSNIISSCYDFSTNNRNVVEIAYWCQSQEDQDGACLEYTIDDGSSWHVVDASVYGGDWNWYTTNVAALGSDGWSGMTNVWIVAREILPAAITGEPKVKFRIHWASDSDPLQSGRGFAFDNFKIYPAPVDVGVSSIIIPDENNCQLDFTGTVQLNVTNYGFNTINAGTDIIIGIDLDGEKVVIDTQSLSTNLLPGASRLFNIPAPLNIQNVGTYEVTAYTMIENDPWFYNTNNDTLSKIINTWQNPITNLPDTISSHEPDTVFLVPHFEPEYYFTWGDGSHTSTYDIDGPGWYYLTVSESNHSCVTYDSVLVELLFNDVGVDSILSPVNSCELSDNEHIQVRIRNFGTDSVLQGSKIYVLYELNSGTAVKDTILLTQVFRRNTTLLHTFTNDAEDFSSIGPYSIHAYAEYGGDTVAGNDGITRTVNVWGYPNLDLGPDLVIPALSYTIVVDPGYVSYEWSDGDTESTKLIDSSGTYTLTVTNNHGCSAIDDIHIWFKIRDIQPVALLNPPSSCNRSGTENVRIRFSNSGSDTLVPADNIYVSFVLDGGTATNEVVHVTSALRPGQTYIHTFNNPVNLMAFGDYEFDITVTTPGDLRTDNDLLDTIIYTSPNPVVTITPKPPAPPNDVIYALNYTLDAGTGPFWTYEWQDGSIGRTYTVTDVTAAFVVVTDSLTGCYASDSVDVYLDILDFAVTGISIGDQPCGGRQENIAIQVLNNGNLPRSDVQFTLNYYLDGTLAMSDIYDTSGLSYPAHFTRTFYSKQPLFLPETGDHELSVDLVTNYLRDDLRPENNELVRDINVLDFANINLGDDDTLGVVLPFTLSVPSGYTSYLWSTNSTTNSIVANAFGNYSVTVTNANGCVNIERVTLIQGSSIFGPDNEAFTVGLFPNPAYDYVTIQIEFEHDASYTLEIFNSQNSMIESREIIAQSRYKDELYIGDLTPGIYFIRIRNNEVNYTCKMIIR